MITYFRENGRGKFCTTLISPFGIIKRPVIIILSCLASELTQQILRPWFATLNRASTNQKVK